MRPTFLPLLMILAIVGNGCDSRRGNPAGQVATDPTASPVRTRILDSTKRMATEEVMGIVRAKLGATLEARLSGRIEKLPVALGGRVRKGELVVRLDAAEIAARMEQAEALLMQAEVDFSRVKALFDKQSATRAEWDSVQSRHREAQGTVAEARAMLSYVEVLAPFDAVVTRKWVEVGDLAQPGRPLVGIENPDTLQLEADVPEGIAMHVKQGTRLRARVDQGESELQGVVNEIAPVADAASRTIRVRLDLEPSPSLRSGQFARLLVPLGERNATFVPASAVVQRGQLDMVFVVTNQKALLHLVSIGRRQGDEVEILSGLRGGETLVISGADQLTDGQPVEVR